MSSTEQKARAIALLATGMPKADVADELGIARSTLWRWEVDDPEFAGLRKRAVDEIVAVGLTELRALVPDVVEAFARGVRSTHREQAIAGGEAGPQIVQLRDDSLAVRTADLIARRVVELTEHLAVDLEPGEALADLIERLDARDAAARAPGSAEGGPGAVRPDEPQDPDEAPTG